MAGISVVILAIVLDRLTQSWTSPTKKKSRKKRDEQAADGKK